MSKTPPPEGTRTRTGIRTTTGIMLVLLTTAILVRVVSCTDAPAQL